jgi:hypothetical protein
MLTYTGIGRVRILSVQSLSNNILPDTLGYQVPATVSFREIGAEMSGTDPTLGRRKGPDIRTGKYRRDLHRITRPRSDTELHHCEDFFIAVPGMDFGEIIRPHNEINLHTGINPFQLMQRIYGIGNSRPVHLLFPYQSIGLSVKGNSQHGKAV